jgi:hypothetical protein
MERAAGRIRTWVRGVVAAGLGLSALALSTGSLGNLTRALNGLLAVVALLGLALLLFPSPRRIRPWRAVLSLAILIAALPLAARGEVWGLLGAALFFFALTLAQSKEGGIVDALLVTALLFAVCRLLVAYVPLLWHAEQWLALDFSWFVGVGLMLGPTALGLPLLVLFGLFAVAVFLLSRAPISPRGEEKPPSPHRGEGAMYPSRGEGRTFPPIAVFVLWLVALILAAVAYVWLQPPLGSWLLTHWPAPPVQTGAVSPLPSLTYLESPLLLFVLCWLGSAVALAVLHPHPLSLRLPASTGRWAAAGLGLLSVATLVLTLDPPGQPQRGAVLFYDAGQLDWGRPVFGQYGAHSGGSFGLLPDYLAAYGYEARIGPLTAENLAAVQAVVLINLPHNLSPDEKDRLLAFVQTGGGLIIWGEHTGLGRIREPTNDLLAALPGQPIRLKFDSAVPVRQGWAEGLTLTPHPALYSVYDPVDLVIAVGASLSIRPPAAPLIVGRYGHSDAGDASNQARNYVGDMVYNPGERLGDVVLAAEVPYGQGHIVVLGDTTPLGSVNLMTTMPFHARLLDWITARPAAGWSWILRNGWLAGLLLLAVGFCLVRARSRSVLAGAALVLGLALALATCVNEKQSAPLLPGGSIAYVDISHQERFDRLLWEKTSIGGLDYNLVRSGMVPLLLRELEAKTLSRAKWLVVIAPGQPFSGREVRAISRWVDGGGRLLVSVGWEESEASRSLLAAFGLRVDSVPLGPAEVERETGTVRFHEAWPIVAGQADARTIVAAYGYPLVTYQPWGAGSVVLIADSEFLLGGTLEGETTYQEGNILLLRDILQGAVLAEETGLYGPSGGEP